MWEFDGLNGWPSQGFILKNWDALVTLPSLQTSIWCEFCQDSTGKSRHFLGKKHIAREDTQGINQHSITVPSFQYEEMRGLVNWLGCLFQVDAAEAEAAAAEAAAAAAQLAESWYMKKDEVSNVANTSHEGHSITHLGRFKQCKSTVNLRDFPYNSALFGIGKW